MKQFLMCSAALIAVAAPAAAFAQSTGSIDFENEIIVTGATTPKGLSGVEFPETSKARGVLHQEIIERQIPGQSVNDIINQRSDAPTSELQSLMRKSSAVFC